MITPISPITSGNIPGAASTTGGGLEKTASVFGDSFSDVLTASSRQVVADITQAEKMSMAALEGKAETRDVVEAVMSAERSLQTAIAIRDKIVTAYLEISRMAI